MRLHLDFNLKKKHIMSDLVKRDDAGFVSQLENFNQKLPSYATLLGITSPEVTASLDDATFMSYVFISVGQSKTYGQGWVAYKDLARDGGVGSLAVTPVPVAGPGAITVVEPGIEERFRLLAKRIKGSQNYTKAIGEDLGIEVAESTSEAITPTLTVKLDGDYPVLGFTKGKADGVRIYSKRGSETAFTFLAIDTRSPYVDNRPNLVPGTPEKREYYAFLYDDDTVIGVQSATISITV
jgi:hypothetical protein